jgi:hypothetical protein
VPLLYRSADEYSDDDRDAVWTEVVTQWTQYVEDCETADTKPTVVDFSVWLIHVKAFVDGVSIGSDRDDEE